MSDCCSTSDDGSAFPSTCRCPVNGKTYAAVSATTIKHHIRNPWQWPQQDQGYYFCSDPACAVVYFGEDGAVIDIAEVRTRIGIKDPSARSLLCYCFGVTAGEALADPEVKAFIIDQTRRGTCACEARNPSGRCCLGEFSKLGKR
jgi:hypothetical protein